ncbi:S8 family serine peptidase [Neobacillus sp. K501]
MNKRLIVILLIALSLSSLVIYSKNSITSKRFSQKTNLMLNSKTYDLLVKEKGIVLTPEIIKKMVGLEENYQLMNQASEKVKPVAVAVLDSGVYPHEDLTIPLNKIIAFKDFVNNYAEPYDDYGHGTFISGLIAGEGPNYKGIFPKANIVGVKVLNNVGEGSLFNTINGINWVIQNKEKYNIKVINISYGFDKLSSNAIDALESAITKADEAGLVIVSSVGNKDVKDAMKLNDRPIYPSAFDRVISVGAMDYVTNSSVFSSYSYKIAPYTITFKNKMMALKPDFILPGTKILSLSSDSEYLPSYDLDLNNKYKVESGSSLSAAILSGVIAKLFEQFPSKSNIEIKAIVLRNRDPIINYYIAKQKQYLNLEEGIGE